MWENLKDRYLTWRTGKTRQVREFEAWAEVTVNLRASTAQAMFSNFEYVFTVDYNKFFFDAGMFLELDPGTEPYRFPQRELGDNIVHASLRGEEMPDGLFHITDFGNEDRVYVATNNSKDAVMIALLYG
jgi:predicted fused transcriptional regulator/phosphomethylpyrimidine kinase